MNSIQPQPQFQKSATSLIDPFGREITYLRLSVTDKCNMRCQYCMAEDMTFLPKSEVMTIEEMIEVAEVFTELGVKKIRLTGGEPLVRKGVDQLIRNLGNLSLESLALTTNGILIEQYLDDLVAANIKKLNVSLDSIDPDIFQKMGRSNKYQQAMSGLAAAKERGISIRLNSVIIPSINDQQVLPLVNFAIENEFDIAFIEEMPLGETISHSSQNEQQLVFSEDVLNTIQSKYKVDSASDKGDKLSGPAKYLQIQGTKTQIGFISPHSQNFCADCNRLRVTVKGRLLLCLGHEQGLDMLPILRAENYQRSNLKRAIVDAVTTKPEKHEFKPHEVELSRFMSMTGG